MAMTDDELRAAHDTIDFERAGELEAFKAATRQHKAYLEQYRSMKRALPRRPKDPEPNDKVVV